eukprot:GHVS01019333.1.p1 GENE.GHVS01019333.1~~GHVS01019333.1.p1  ORF type:complete len:285 (+),score=62.05 GHVS01019333.1:119-973(+)
MTEISEDIKMNSFCSFVPSSLSFCCCSSLFCHNSNNTKNDNNNNNNDYNYLCSSSFISSSKQISSAADSSASSSSSLSTRRPFRLFLSSSFLFLLFLLLHLFVPSTGINVSLDLHASQKRCFGEQLGKHVLLMGEFKSDGPLQLSVTSPSSTIFQDKNKNEIRTAFTTQSAGTHMFCIHNMNRTSLHVQMSIVFGPEARDYSQIAKRDHLNDVVVKLRKVEDQLKLYHHNISRMRERARGLRMTNDSTSSRVIAFCVLDTFLLVTSAVAQAYYFRRFFRSKKII